MIYSVTGKVVGKSNNLAVIESGSGVAFAVHTSNMTLSKLKDEDTLYTYLYVREDAIELYGFSTQRELNTFKMLISVSGIGCKVALSVLSDMTSEDFALTVVSGDSKMLTGVKGIGAKTAQRIVLELKDRLSKNGIDTDISSYSQNNSSVSEALSALTVLGYSQNEIAPIIAKLDRTLSSSELIKETLKLIVKSK